MALGNKKSVDDAAFERIYKRIQYNTIYTYMEFQYDEIVVEPVAEVVKSVLEPDIDDQILSAFMELDPVFNPTDVDTDIELNTEYQTLVESNANKLYYFLHDKDDEKIAAEVSPNLVASYKEKDFAQTFVSIIRRDWLIQVNSNTVITENPFSEETGFQMHAWLLSIRSLVEDKTHRKMLIDTIGRVIRGGLKQPKGVNTCEIWLRDLTGAEIKFVSNHTLRKVA
ncbi:hypothetical protein Tco_0763793 [Tanacetum coccineum]